MQDAENYDVVTLENQITERYGLLISQTQLAELLGRTTGGLRYSLSYPSDQSTRALKVCGRKIGRRVYYPATEVARIIIGMVLFPRGSTCGSGNSHQNHGVMVMGSWGGGLGVGKWGIGAESLTAKLLRP